MITAATVFELADRPFGTKPFQTPDSEVVARMIDRLRTATGQDFGFDPNGTAEQNEAAIAAWENWWQENAADYGVSP